jgi:hypothetical protein
LFHLLLGEGGQWHNRYETVLRIGGKVIKHAGFPSPPRCGKQDMLNT